MEDDECSEFEPLIVANAKAERRREQEELQEARGKAAKLAAALGAPEGARLLRALSCHPQDLHFVVPAGARPGDSACIEGPHGPIRVPVPPGARPGEESAVRLGPEAAFQLTVPKGVGPGDKVGFVDEEGKVLEVLVPEGKLPGDLFDVFPPALMVQVPDGARVGDQLLFDALRGDQDDEEGRWMTATVPPGVAPGGYFAALQQE